MVCVSVTVLLHNAVESLFCLATLLCLNMCDKHVSSPP